MARYQFDEKETRHETTFADAANGVLDFLVRLAGLVLLCVGLWTGVAIIKEAWSLYQHPNSGAVERFAAAIDKGSHLDRLLASKHQKDDTSRDAATEYNPGTVIEPSPSSPGNTGSPAAAKPSPPAKTTANDQLKLSYFVAWAILLLVMLLVGRLSIAAIKTGGELALHDVQIKRFARQLLREMNRKRDD